MAYSSYGGRGVKVCEEWEREFESFYQWAICNGWRKGLELDKDIIGDGLLYSPQNCIFVTRKINNQTRRISRRIVIDGVVMTVQEVANKEGLSYSRAHAKYKNNLVFLHEIKQ